MHTGESSEPPPEGITSGAAGSPRDPAPATDPQADPDTQVQGQGAAPPSNGSLAPDAGAAAGGAMPPWIFWLELAYLLILGVLFYAYHHSSDFRDDFPSIGPFPMGVLWFGALGGVMVGMSGIFFHNRRWDGGYNYWQVSRPFMGAAAGGMGALLFYVAILLGNSKTPTPNHLTFEAVAFVFGFADDAFRSIIKKVTDILLTTTPSPAGGPAGASHERPSASTGQTSTSAAQNDT